MRYHVYVVLIQDVKDLIRQNNAIVCHIHREGNQCTNFMANLRTGSDIKLLYHVSPPADLLYLLKMEAIGILLLMFFFPLFFLVTKKK